MKHALILAHLMPFLVMQSPIYSEQENESKLAKSDIIELQSSVIVYAIETHNEEMLEEVLKDVPKDFIMKGANRGWGGFTPLTYAVFYAKLNTFKTIVGKGFSVDCFDGYGCRPIDWVLKLKRESKVIEKSLYREDDGGEQRAIEVFVLGKLGNWVSRDVECYVNGKALSEKWKSAIKRMPDVGEQKIKLSINWEKVNDATYRYTFNFGGNLSGGGGSGMLLSHKGYWVFDKAKTWDN